MENMENMRYDNLNKEDILEIINQILPKNKNIPKEKVDDIFSFITSINELIINRKQKNSEKNITLAKEFLELSKKDISISKYLYDKKDFSNSVYHLQQSVEKLTKAFGLAFFMLNKNDFKGKKGVSHKTPLAFVKMLNVKWVEPYISLMKSFYPNLKTDTKELEEIIHKKKYELAKLNENEIRNFLNLAKNIKHKLEDKDVKRQITNIIDNILSSSLLPETSKESKALHFLRNNFKIDFVISFISLYLLSVITYPHFSYTRYPDEEIKPTEYTMSRGIVKVSPEIWKFLDESLKLLDEYLKEEMCKHG